MKKLIIKSLLYILIFVNTFFAFNNYAGVKQLYAQNIVDNPVLDVIKKWNTIKKQTKDLYEQFLDIENYIKHNRKYITNKQMDFFLHQEFIIAEKIYKNHTVAVSQNLKNKYLEQSRKICTHIISKASSDSKFYPKVLLLLSNVHNKENLSTNLYKIIHYNQEIINNTNITNKYYKMKAYYNLIYITHTLTILNIHYEENLQKTLNLYDQFNIKYGHINNDINRKINKLIDDLLIKDIKRNLYLSRFYEQQGNKKASIKYFRRVFFNNYHLADMKNKDKIYNIILEKKYK